MTEQPGPGPLVQSTVVAEKIAAGVHLVLLDVRWSLAGAQRKVYLEGHLPGAVFADLDVDLADVPAESGAGGRHRLPDPVRFQEFLRSAGISERTPVVVYDGSNSAIAARAWWLLRWAGHQNVRVLDGGFGGWQRGGFPVQTGETADAAPGNIVVRAGSMPVADIDVIDAVSSGGDAVGHLLDARAPERFSGAVEPADPVGGHIPGAVNLPLTELVTERGTFRTAEEIAERFADLGVVAGGSPAIASCGSGVTACHLILAGEIAGLELALYAGSYSGWCAAGRPIATGISDPR